MQDNVITIYEADINLVYELDSHVYGKTMKGVVPEQKQREFKMLKDKMQALSDYYQANYDNSAGPFKSERTKGNPISHRGKLRRVWSGLFKGAENKQYSVQISFVVNANAKCLDVGIYFGRASAMRISKEKRLKLEEEIRRLGALLYNYISIIPTLNQAYHSLFEYGFKAEIRGKRVTSEEWLLNLNDDPTNSSITISLLPNEKGEIESASIDLYVAMVMPLLKVVPEHISANTNQFFPKKLKSLSPEQRAKQAEKRALIGLNGEKFVIKKEEEKLRNLGFPIDKNPIHQSLISDGLGYDILSYDDLQNELFIEVKTTTLLKQEPTANTFFISAKEYSFYENNKDKYRLYRVYDIYGEPHYEILKLDEMHKSIENYKMSY